MDREIIDAILRNIHKLIIVSDGGLYPQINDLKLYLFPSSISIQNVKTHRSIEVSAAPEEINVITNKIQLAREKYDRQEKEKFIKILEQ